MKHVYIVFVIAVYANVLPIIFAASSEISTDVNRLENGLDYHSDGGENYLERVYTVSLQLVNKSSPVRICSGVRLDEHWYLTAAECFDDAQYDKVNFTYTYRNETISRIHSTVMAYVKIHPEYNQTAKTNNIALVRCPVCPHRYGNLTEVAGMVVMQSRILNNFLCKLLHKFSWHIEENHVCSSAWGYPPLSKKEVGAPLVIKQSDGTPKLIGVATTTGTPWTTLFSLPMVFTRVAPYIYWIHNKTTHPLED